MKKRGIMGNKMAQGHIEMILSFVLFIGFLFVILYFFSPVKQKSIDASSLESAQKRIVDNLTVSYNKVSLILNKSICGCFSLTSISPTNGLLVKDLSGNIIKSVLAGNTIYIQPKASCDRYYVLYYDTSSLNSYVFPNSGCLSLSPSNYSYGLVSSESPVLYERVTELNNSYANNYQNLKSSLGLGRDFLFLVVNDSKSIVFQQSIYRPKGVNILSRSIPLAVINKDANQSGMVLNIQVW